MRVNLLFVLVVYLLLHGKMAIKYQFCRREKRKEGTQLYMNITTHNAGTSDI